MQATRRLRPGSFTSLTPEVRWLVDCARSLATPGTTPSSAVAPCWEAVTALAEAEGLAPALGYLVKTGSLGRTVPPDVREALGRRFADAVAGQLLLAGALGRLLREFRRRGVSVIPLKGPALAEALYPDPALRPSTDLDLLVRPQQVVAADDLLQGLGYRRLADAHSWSFDLAYDRATLYAGPGGVHVDLHWSLLSDPRYVWNAAQERSVWDRARPISVAGEAALTLCREDLLLYLAMHLAVHHALAGLLWYWDLALLLRQQTDLDWDGVVQRARRWRVGTALYFALLGCQRLFDVAAPGHVMARLRPRGPRALLLHRLLRSPDSVRLRRREHLIALLLVDRPGDLIAPLIGAVLPSPAWLRARYDGPGASLPGRYWAHLRRMTTIAGATVGSSATRIERP